MFADLAQRLKFAEFLGRDPHPSAAGLEIYHVRAPNFPEFHFEWHPRKRRVYVARVGTEPMVGEIVAFNIETQGDAYNAVLIWLRGLQEGRGPGVKPHLIG